MYKKNTRNSKKVSTQDNNLLNTINRIVDEKAQIEILDFDENTKYEEKKKEIKKTSNISKQINRKLNADEVLDFDKTTAFEPIKINNVKNKNNKKKNIKKTSKITKQVNRKLNTEEILDFDKTTAFEPIKINNIKKKPKNKITIARIIKNIKKTYKSANKKVKNKLNRQEVLDFDKTTTFEPINLDKYKKPQSRKEILNKYTKFRKTLTACVILTFCFIGVQQFTTENSIIMQQARKVLTSIGIYTEEINTSTINSPNYGEESSWKIDRQVKWVDTNKAELTINLNSVIKTDSNIKNIILLLDTSKSMTGEKLDTLKDVLKNYINDILKYEDIQISIVTFSTSAQVKAYLTNDKELLLNAIDDIPLNNDTNYSAAIKSINEVLDKNRTNGENTVAVLLTDGYPNVDTGSHQGEYNLVKDSFPEIKINAIQYEVGSTIIDELKKVSDKQRSATKSNIRRVLLESTISPDSYENMKITDYLSNDYFTINNLSDIKTSIGTPMILEGDNIQKIEWNLEDNYVTGENETLKATLTLKDEYVSTEGIYLVNESTEITSKKKNEEEVTNEYKNPLVLQNVYKVIYQTNRPEGCAVDDKTTDKYFVSTNVSKLSKELNCPGYLFKGWELNDEDEKEVQKINTDVFLMPSHDITLKGTWTKQSLTMSMDGKVNEKTTLYNVIKNEAEKGTYAKEYTGEHQDSFDASLSTEKIYHYYASNDAAANEILNKNNVIFGGQCWQMIRTTDTGGVKLIYNGEQENNQCLNTRGTHAGYNDTSTQTLTSNYWYGESYEYDKINKTFKLTGSLQTATWDATTGPSLVGKYTCKKTGPDSTCTTLYYIESVNSASQANTLVLNNNSHYSQYGETKYNNETLIFSQIGYMYNEHNTIFALSTIENVYSTEKLNKQFWYGNSIEWSEEENMYAINDSNLVAGINYSDLVGKYVYEKTNDSYTASSVHYVAAVTESEYYFIDLSDGHDLDYYNYTYTYGESYIKNADGTYTISNPQTIKRIDIYENRENLKNMYACKGTSTNYCNEILHFSNQIVPKIYYASSEKEYTFSKDFTYINSKYILNESNAKVIWDFYTDESIKIINNAHYTCNNRTKECNKIQYVFKNASTIGATMIELENGENIDDVINKLFDSDDLNTNNSIIKTAIENWYAIYLSKYTNFIEDTIYCNDRTIIDKAGWDTNGGNINEDLKFTNYNSNNSIKCYDIKDMYSINNSKAKLNYKVGLMTNPEMILLNNKNSKNTSKAYWLMTPIKITHNTFVSSISSNGGLSAKNLTTTSGVRPAISLRPGIEYLEGDGSMEYPYLIDTTEE